MRLFIDISKAGIRKDKLIQKPVMVRGKNGKIFTRMQWVDPKTGKPVGKKGNKKPEVSDGSRKRKQGIKEATERKLREDVFNPDNREKYSSLTDKEKKDIIDKVVKTEYGQDYAEVLPMVPSREGTTIEEFFMETFDKIPLDVLYECTSDDGTPSLIDYDNDEIIQFNREEPTKLELEPDPPTDINRTATSIRGGVPKLGLKHLNSGLSENEVSMRCGDVGPISKDAMDRIFDASSGTSIIEEFSLGVLQLPTGVLHESLEVDTAREFQNIFKTSTKEGMESVFSCGGLRASLTDIMPYIDGNDVKMSLTFDLKDSMGNHAGTTEREAHRDKEGMLHVRNELLIIEREHANTGVGAEMYSNVEQYWKRLSGGHPLTISLQANINVGVYSWATKGYDFESPQDVITAREELSHFCTQNDVDMNSLLENNGYTSIDEINHSWEFASLDDGNSWDLGALSSNFPGQLFGEAHFGKAFMMGGKSEWEGKKTLNAGNDYDSVSKLFDKFRKARRNVRG